MDELLFRSLKGILDADEEASVRAWRRESPANERYYRELAEVLGITARSDASTGSTPPSPFKLIHEAESRSQVRTRMPPGGAQRRERAFRRWMYAGVAAAAVLLLSIAMGRIPSSGPAGAAFETEEFASGPAEASTVTLRDGTVVRLGPQSRLRVTPGKERDVSLWGRALFSVANDPVKTFRIETRGGLVEVLGTRFEIESRDDDLRVAVIEGRVALSARGQRTEVPAGEMRRVVGGATLPAVRIPDGIAVGDWVGNFLAFQDTPLQDAAVEIGRLYDVSITVPDSALARQTITAWFSDQTLEQVMKIICMVADAACTQSETGAITIDSARSR